MIELPEGKTLATQINETLKGKRILKLIYLDFDTRNEIDVAYYPDSGKIGIWGKDVNKVFRIGDQVGYYEGE